MVSARIRPEGGTDLREFSVLGKLDEGLVGGDRRRTSGETEYEWVFSCWREVIDGGDRTSDME